MSYRLFVWWLMRCRLIALAHLYLLAGPGSRRLQLTVPMFIQLGRESSLENPG